MMRRLFVERAAQLIFFGGNTEFMQS